MFWLFLAFLSGNIFFGEASSITSDNLTPVVSYSVSWYCGSEEDYCSITFLPDGTYEREGF